MDLSIEAVLAWILVRIRVSAAHYRRGVTPV